MLKNEQLLADNAQLIEKLSECQKSASKMQSEIDKLRKCVSDAEFEVTTLRK